MRDRGLLSEQIDEFVRAHNSQWEKQKDFKVSKEFFKNVTEMDLSKLSKYGDAYRPDKYKTGRQFSKSFHFMQVVVTNCEIKFDLVFSKAMDDYLSDSEKLTFMDLVNLSS